MEITEVQVDIDKELVDVLYDRGFEKSILIYYCDLEYGSEIKRGICYMHCFNKRVDDDNSNYNRYIVVKEDGVFKTTIWKDLSASSTKITELDNLENQIDSIISYNQQNI